MKTKNLIQLNANVIKITNLQKGDVFKMVEDQPYGDPLIKYGVVIDLMNDGENTYIESLIYKKEYSSADGTIKIFKGSDDVALFPCTLDEVENHFKNSIKSLDEKIIKEEEELNKLKESTEKVKQFISGEMTKELKEVEYKEMTQNEYDDEKKLKEQKLRELSE